VIGALIGAVSFSGRHRLGQARRAHGQALHLPRPAVRQPRVLPRHGRARRVAGVRPGDRCGSSPSSCWRCAGRADDPADRRRRHAGGDLAATTPSPAWRWRSKATCWATRR
jgi:hypothetical protein